MVGHDVPIAPSESAALARPKRRRDGDIAPYPVHGREHGRGAKGASHEPRARSGRDAFHRVRDFPWAQSLDQNRDLGDSGALGFSFERSGIGV